MSDIETKNQTEHNTGQADWTDYMPSAENAPKFSVGFKTPLPKGDYELPFGKDSYNIRIEHDLVSQNTSIGATLNQPGKPG